jgi:hypothetical protein
MNCRFDRVKWVSSQSSLIRRFVRNAQRPAKVLFRLRKKRPYSLWRPESVSGLLSRFCNSSLPSAFGSLARLRLPGLPSRRPVPGPCLFHRGGLGSHREHSVPDPQRTHPASVGSERFPASGHAPNLLAAFRSGVLAKLASGPRQSSVGTLPPAQPPLQRYRGCRYNDADYLRAMFPSDGTGNLLTLRFCPAKVAVASAWEWS